MAYTLPTFRELLTRVQTDLGEFTDGTTPARSIEFVLSRVMARLSRGLYSYQSWILRQVFPDTADDINFWRHSARFGVTPKPAVQWQGTYQFTGSAGAVVPDGTTIQRSDGELYTTIGATTLPALATIEAQDASAAAACDDGQTLSLGSPLASVDTDGTVTGTTVIGSDVEQRPGAQLRLTQRLANPPRGGGPGNFASWALEVPGVTRAWEFGQLEGPNSVSIAFARDNDADPVPDSGARAAVLAYINARKPITVTIYMIAMSAAPVNLTLSALDPNTPDQGTAIETAVRALVLRVAAPGATLPLSQINAAISSAGDGETSHTLSSPSADVVFATNQLPVMGTVTRP